MIKLSLLKFSFINNIPPIGNIPTKTARNIDNTIEKYIIIPFILYIKLIVKATINLYYQLYIINLFPSSCFQITVILLLY